MRNDKDRLRGVVVHCKTEDEMRLVFETFLKAGYTIHNGEDTIDSYMEKYGLIFPHIGNRSALKSIGGSMCRSSSMMLSFEEFRKQFISNTLF